MIAPQFSGRVVLQFIQWIYLIAVFAVLSFCRVSLAQNNPAPMVPNKEFAFRVVTPGGQAIHIDDISSIMVMISVGPWSEGPKPEIRRRFPGEWVAVDQDMFALAGGGMVVQITIHSGGVAMLVGGRYPPGGPRTMELTAYGTPIEIGADLSAGPSPVADGDIAGQVVDPQGNPVTGAVVSFPRPAQFARLPHTEPTTTGADGVFRFAKSDLRGGAYMQVEAQGYAPRWINDQPRGKGFMVHLDNRTRLKGKLTLPDGSPAANAKIDLTDSKASLRYPEGEETDSITLSGTADAKGNYDLPVEPGEYDVKLSAAGGFVARTEHFGVYSGKEAPLPGELKPGVNLTIQAFDTLTAQPVAGVRFNLQQWTPGYITDVAGTDRTTDAQGMAEWDGIMPGPQRVGVKTTEYGRWWMMKPGQKEQGRERGIDSISLTLEVGMPTVMVAMEPPMHVSGQVLAPTGEPAAGVLVDVGRLWTGDSRYHGKTDEKGNFSIAFACLRSPYTDAEMKKLAIVACDSKKRWANGISEEFDAQPGAEKKLVVRMTTGGRFRGQVVDAAGKGVPGIEVVATASDQIDRSYYSPRALTDAQGAYDLGPVRPAEYELHPTIHFGSSIPISIVDGKTRSEVHDNAPVVSVRDQEVMEVKPIVYDGPPPSPLPDYYKRMYPWGDTR
jgi:protocatechuate 3,4-dioxygenase beta subunit